MRLKTKKKPVKPVSTYVSRIMFTVYASELVKLFSLATRAGSGRSRRKGIFMHAKGGGGMTIEEAKEKWCCNKEVDKCLADECMAWRRFDPEVKENGYCGLAGKEGAE